MRERSCCRRTHNDDEDDDDDGWDISLLFLIAEPLTTIVGGPEIFINTGSTINLTCIVKNSPESPFAMYWTHNNEVRRARKS